MKEQVTSLIHALPELGVSEYLDILPLLLFYRAKKGDVTITEFKETIHELNNEYNGILGKLVQYITPLENKELKRIYNALLLIDKILEQGEDAIPEVYTTLGHTPKYSKALGLYYTPQNVSHLLTQLIVPENGGKTAYDPCCGIGGLLLNAHKRNPQLTLYGQELSKDTANLTRVNLLLNSIEENNFEVAQGDVLESPAHLDKRFDIILGNPPFSAKWSADKSFNTDPRFRNFKRIAPKSRADYSFIQHMIYQLSDDGILGVILPHGVLFRGGAEESIRKQLIKDNLLDAVIGLPEKLFPGTQIPTIILVYKKNRKKGEDILFIDAKEECIDQGTKRNSLSNENIEKIVDTYKNRKEIERFSHNTSLEEIEENYYNLNIARYVDTYIEEDPVDLGEVREEIDRIDEENEKITRDIIHFCDELGIVPPISRREEKRIRGEIE